MLCDIECDVNWFIVLCFFLALLMSDLFITSSVTCWFSWKRHFCVLLKTIVFAFEREDCPPTGWLNLLFFHMKNALRFSREKSHYLTFSTLFIWKRSLFWPLKEFTFNGVVPFFHNSLPSLKYPFFTIKISIKVFCEKKKVRLLESFPSFMSRGWPSLSPSRFFSTWWCIHIVFCFMLWLTFTSFATS